MQLPPSVEGRFIRRLNRFAALVQLPGGEALVHVPNSGRMEELLVPDAPVRLRPVSGVPGRKTRFDLLLVRHGETWVGVDARLPNGLFEEALSAGRLRRFQGFRVARREARWGQSRFDFLLTDGAGFCLVETKSVNLVVDGTAMFPDAPTIRGQRHVQELIQAREEGMEGAIVFIVQRPDARRLTPHDEADPEFGAALRRAQGARVNLVAYRCHVTPEEMAVKDEIPVVL